MKIRLVVILIIIMVLYCRIPPQITTPIVQSDQTRVVEISPSPSPVEEDACIPVLPAKLENAEIPGRWVLTIDELPFLYESNTGSLDSSIQYPNTEFYLEIYVTSDKMAYSYHDTQAGEDSVMIQYLDGSRYERIPIVYDDVHWNGIYSWANPISLVLIRYENYPDHPITVYNTERHEEKQIPLDYPEISLLDLWSWRMWGSMGVISPDLDKLVYLGVTKLIIHDLSTNQEITMIDDFFGNPTQPPQWSPDGQQISFIRSETINKEKWYFIDNLSIADLDGHITQVTNFNDQNGLFKLMIYSVQWSPSGMKIAFWINEYTGTQPDTGYQLSIVDVKTQQVDTYCLFTQTWPLNPVWSNDERYLGLNVSDSKDSLTSSSYVLNLVGNEVVHLFDNSVIYGWIK
jgi:hypothetical protein